MLELPMIFGDGMVLQRQKPIEIWGKAAPGEAVTAELGYEGQAVATAKTAAGEDGTFRLFLPALEVGRDLTLTVVSGGESAAFHDVLIGEVWIAGGQSNMEYFMNFDAERETAYAWDEPELRFFDYPEVCYEGEPQDYDFSEFGFWRRCRREDLPWWSAVGAWFAKKLHGETGVPVGIVGCNWGGTRACCWMGREYLEGTPGEVWLRDYERDNRGVDPAEYKKAYLAIPANIGNHPLSGDTTVLWPGLTREFQLKALEMMAAMEKPPYYDLIGPCHPWRPCGVYETMLKNVAPYTCRGVLWYQGESDDAHPEIYDTVLENLISNWRSLWHDELPFLMTQLAPFGAWLDCNGDKYPIVRERQERAARTIPGVWLASSSDTGMEWDIHPKHKRPIGERLALLALGHVYGFNIPCDAPELREARWADGKLTLSFAYGDGLQVRGERVNALTVDGIPVSGVIKDNTLVITMPEKPRWVELAQSGYYEVNLYNAAGLPAKPFSAEVK